MHEDEDPSEFVTTSTFTDFSFIATYGTSDGVSLLAALVHLHSATLDFRQSGWSELQSTLRYAQRNKKPKKAESLKPVRAIHVWSESG